MKVVGYTSEKEILVSMSPEDLAAITGLGTTHKLREAFPQCFSYPGFTPDIVGTKLNVSSVFKDATDALTLHKEALSAATSLKKASSRFLGFFANDK